MRRSSPARIARASACPSYSANHFSATLASITSGGFNVRAPRE